MTRPLGTYSFLPWLRRGLANQITSSDLDSAVKLRAEVEVELKLTGKGIGGGSDKTESVSRNVALFGPGDIQGIERRAFVRLEPRHWITSFEPNYLPHIEFYDEDFAWRYTPASPDVPKGRLRPWIMLVVLEESEFTEGKDIRDKPLPYVEVGDASVFPPAEQLWAWAHVHVNRSLAANDDEFRSTDQAAITARLRAVSNENPDLAYSRIICPRKLDANNAYHAFLMPVFETGRLSGLGLPLPSTLSATFSAWASYTDKQEPTRFPYYHRWYFRTGATGDFESLVRLLKPKPVDKRVGTRALDVQYPGLNVRGVDDPDLKGILKLGGALRVPRKNYTPEELAGFERYENWATPYPRPIQEDLARLINLSDDYAELAAGAANIAVDIRDPEDPTQHDPDPLVTLPLYGTWHAMTKRLLANFDRTPIVPSKNWVHELNLDPRFRVAAGFGTRVVQDQQEVLMDQAWEQIGRILEASRRIRLGQLAREVSFIWYDRHLAPLVTTDHERALSLMAPLNKRVRGSEFTIHHHLGESFVQPAMISAALRRVLRTRGRLMRKTAFTPEMGPRNLLARVNESEGKVSAAPPRSRPKGVVTVNDIADRVLPENAPGSVVAALRRWPWFRWVPIVVALICVVLLFLLAPAGVAAGVAIAVTTAASSLTFLLSRWTVRIRAADALREETRTPDAIRELPLSPDFRISEPGSGFTPARGNTDSAEAVRFKAALKDAYTLISASTVAGAVPAKKKLDNLSALTATILKAINPDITIPRRVMAGVFIPARIRLEMGEQFVEPMAYPVFDTPMYEPLKKLSDELFLPNINLIEQNSVTLLETNQKFIESYLVGLNHEFARELLWREYPTDQRGSYFRQFWDVKSFFNKDNLDDEALKEELRDIPPLHTWPRASELGAHDNREVAGENKQELVLVIRGELLKRYPTAVIYAHRACWQRKDDGTDADKATHPCFRSGAIDKVKERRLVPLTEEEETTPPFEKVRTPLYEATVDPDIHFFGFDLTVEEAAGGTGEHPDDDPGWFFVIKERPGEPRFGLDTEQQPLLNVWNDLSWPTVQPGPAGSFIEITDATPTLSVIMPTGAEEEKLEQYNDDRHVTWSKDMTSADIAYMLFQAPVLVAVHATEMLPQ